MNAPRHFLVAVLAIAAAIAGCKPAETLPPTGPDARESESRADRATRRKMALMGNFVFNDNKLEDVIQYLRDVGGISIYVNWGALEAIGIEKSTPVNVELHDVTFERALRTVLRDAGGVARNTLRYQIDEGVITISTADDLATMRITKVYDVNDLIGLDRRDRAVLDDLVAQAMRRGPAGGDARTLATVYDSQPGALADDLAGAIVENRADSLVSAIRVTVSPDSWQTNGGLVGSLEAAGTNLVITQTAEGHEQVWRLLAQLRDPKAAAAVEGSKADQVTRRKLAAIQQNLSFIGFKIEDVVQFLRDAGGVNIYVNWGALQNVGVEKSTQVNVQLRNVTFEKALRTVLRDVGGERPDMVRYVIDDGVVTISMKDEFACHRIVRVYHVGDLVGATSLADADKRRLTALLVLALQQPLPQSEFGTSIFDTSIEDPARRRLLATSEAIDDELGDREAGRLAGVIRGSILTDSWRLNGGLSGSIWVVRTKLVVTQTIEGHDQIRRILAALREPPGTQASNQAPLPAGEVPAPARQE